MSVSEEQSQVAGRVPGWLRQRIPVGLRRGLNRLYWYWYDARDYMAEVAGQIPSHTLRRILFRSLLRIPIGPHTSIHRGCRFYLPRGVHIGAHTVINRDVVLDGRSGLTIGDNVSISEGVMLLTLEHDPNSASFENRGAPVTLCDRVFIGAQAMILPGVTVGEGAVVAARAVVTRDVEPYAIVAGIPARKIGERTRDLSYILDYRKFLG